MPQFLIVVLELQTDEAGKNHWLPIDGMAPFGSWEEAIEQLGGRQVGGTSTSFCRIFEGCDGSRSALVDVLEQAQIMAAANNPS